MAAGRGRKGTCPANMFRFVGAWREAAFLRRHPRRTCKFRGIFAASSRPAAPCSCTCVLAARIQRDACFCVSSRSNCCSNLSLVFFRGVVVCVVYAARKMLGGVAMPRDVTCHIVLLRGAWQRWQSHNHNAWVCGLC